MKSRLSPSPTIAALFLLCACTQSDTDQRAQEDRAEPETAVPADEVGAAGTNVPGVPARDDTSSGMPVPGTNTPEHIVENGNSDHNSMNNM